MVQFRWIKVSLFMMLLLQFTAVTGQNQPSFIVRVGDDVTLPCENVMKDQDKCDSATWIVNRNEGGTAVELVNLGKIRKHLIPKARSDRLSVTEKCSLVIKKVTVDDVGRYTCRQFNKSGEQQGPDSVIYLSVVNIDKDQTDDSVMLTCDVLTYRGCGYTVKWLYDDDKNDTETTPLTCSAMMTFSPHLHQKSNNVSVKCKVTDDKSGQTLLSDVSLESSGDKTEEDTPTQAVTGQNQPSFIVRVGDDVTLPCENVMKDQDKCDSATWISSWKEGGTAVELVNLGQIRKHLTPKARSDRLSVTEKCSLVIKKVTVDDAGRYTCSQFNKSGKQQGPDSHVSLSVVYIDKDQTDDSVMLTCAVLTYRGCGYTVKWLYDDDKNDTETFDCTTIKTFSPHLHQKSNNVSVKCKVTDDESGQTLLSDVSLESSGDKTGGNKTSSAEEDTPTQGKLWIIIVAVGLGALLIAIVAVTIWKKSKGRETQMEGNTGQGLNPALPPSAPKTSEDMADPEDGVSYASVSFTRKTNSKARVCGDDDDVTVTYSTVKASSSPAGASADLYATVNKPKTNGAAV